MGQQWRPREQARLALMASAAFQRSEEHLRLGVGHSESGRHVEWKGVRSSGLKPHWRACTPSDEIYSHPYDGIITQVSSSAAALYVPRDPHTEART